jgi:hypothetical protein
MGQSMSDLILFPSLIGQWRKWMLQLTTFLTHATRMGPSMGDLILCPYRSVAEVDVAASSPTRMGLSMGDFILFPYRSVA